MEIKIPFYNILNMFLTGLVFMGVSIIIFPNYAISLLENGIILKIGAGPEIIITICIFSVAYEIGLIINRIGSIIIEPILKATKIIPFDDDYVKYNIAKKKYSIMSTLSREYALSRTGIALFLLLAMLTQFGRTKFLIIPFFFVVFIYTLSCRKHSQKIVSLMSDTTDENNT